MGSRQAKRNQSENYADSADNNDYRKTTNGYPYYGANHKLIHVNKKARQLPSLGQQSSGIGKWAWNKQTGVKWYICAYSDSGYAKKAQTAAFKSKPQPVHTTTATDDGEIVSPRAQKFSKFIGEQIRIEINKQKVEIEELNSNPIESKNLLFYDFNAGARQFSFGLGNNPRLATRAEFRLTGMAGAKLIDVNKIEPSDVELNKAKRRPTTSHFRGGDRLPSRASKTRERAKRIQLAARKNQKQKTVTRKIIHMPDSMSPKNDNIYGIPSHNMPVRPNVYTAIPNKKHRMFVE